MIPKNTAVLWNDRDALEAAEFYARTFPDTRVGAVHRAPGDFPDGKQGDILVVEFEVMGIPCAGLNGRSAFRQTEAYDGNDEDRRRRDRSRVPGLTVA